MKLTYYGHSCFGVEVAGMALLLDPFISPNPLAESIDVDAVPADFILLSHGHADHVADAVRIAQRTGGTVIANFEVANWIGAQGVTKIHPMNHGGSCGFDFGRVKYVKAVHSSSLPDGSYGGQPGGFVVAAKDGGSFYFAGDTALTLDMKLIAEEFDLRFAALPIGDNFTMGAADAAKAAGFLGCDEVVGMHYDTFPPICIDHDVARAAFQRAGRRLHLLEIGETRAF
ncbi:MAG: metal-dependent hydrolase [Terrimicrobiaceae bacterium]|nr:metal-dependent hydrolase [Terrimicrobiaceae bacterium]